MTETDVRLTGWGTFEDLPSIRPLLFGEMVKRSNGVIEEYHSDLYHDAQWLGREVNGETSFAWVVRPSGTHIGETARIVMENDSLWQKGGVAYIVHLFPRGGEWFAWFEVAKDDRPGASPSTEEDTDPDALGDCDYHEGGSHRWQTSCVGWQAWAPPTPNPNGQMFGRCQRHPEYEHYFNAIAGSPCLGFVQSMP